MHFPEQQLLAYLRVFQTQERAEETLNDVATTALAADVESRIEFFCLAHWLMDSDQHRSVLAEVVALTEEAGLSVSEAAIVLDLPVGEVEAARSRAWDESPEPRPEGGMPRPEGGMPRPEGGTPGSAVAKPVAALAGRTADVDVASGTDIGTTDSRRRGRVATLVAAIAVVVGAAGALGLVMLSPAGQTRLMAQGVDPVLGWIVLAGLISGGAALIGVRSVMGER